MIETNIINQSTVITDRILELEGQLNEHIEQEAAREAAHDAAGREMRAMINQHSDECVAEMEAAYARQQRKEYRAFREAQREKFLIRNFMSLAIAALFAIGVAFEAVILDLGIVVTTVAILFCIGNFVVYTTMNNRKTGGKNHAANFVSQR